MADFDINQYVFIDTETTGLHVQEHGLLELTYAIGLEEPKTLYVSPWNVEEFLADADPQALIVNKYLERFAGDDEGAWYYVPPEFRDADYYLNTGYDRAWLNLPSSPEEDWEEFYTRLLGKTWVGANPSFDVGFVSEYFAPQYLPHHHRLFDIQVWVAGYTKKAKVPSMKDLAADYSTVQPDHSSYKDVLALREVFINTVGAVSWPHTSVLGALETVKSH